MQRPQYMSAAAATLVDVYDVRVLAAAEPHGFGTRGTAPSPQVQWADRIDGTIDDVFDMQDRVPGGIVAALALALPPEEAARLVEHPIEDAAAYGAHIDDLKRRKGADADQRHRIKYKPFDRK